MLKQVASLAAVVAMLSGCTGPTLTRIDDVGPGSDCALGGQAIRTGTDTNGNGVLDATEVTNSQFACATATSVVIDGSLVINDADDLGALIDAQPTEITGHLILRGDLGAVALPTLQKVGGEVQVRDSNVTELSMSSLTSVAALRIVNNPSLGSLAGFSSLTTVGDGGVDIVANDSLDDLGAGTVTSIGGNVRIADNDSLVDFDGFGTAPTLGNVRVENKRQPRVDAGLGT